MSSSTTNMVLTKPDLTDTADVRVLNGNMDKLDVHRHAGGTDGLPVRSVQAGTLSARPAAGNAGQLYVATDGPALYIDNGSAWTQIQNSGTQTGESWLTAKSSSVPNGSITQFNIGAGVASKKVQVWKNGLLKVQVDDYTFIIGEDHIHFLVAPPTGDVIITQYVIQ